MREWRCLRIESGFEEVWEEPLDEAVVFFQQSIVSPPFFVNDLDEISLWGRWSIAQMELDIRHNWLCFG